MLYYNQNKKKSKFEQSRNYKFFMKNSISDTKSINQKPKTVNYIFPEKKIQSWFTETMLQIDKKHYKLLIRSHCNLDNDYFKLAKTPKTVFSFSTQFSH